LRKKIRGGTTALPEKGMRAFHRAFEAFHAGEKNSSSPYYLLVMASFAHISQFLPTSLRQTVAPPMVISMER
jgi:hypothetical protein